VPGSPLKQQRRVAPRITVTADEGSKTGGSGTSSSSLSSYAVGEDHHYLQQGKQRTNSS